MESSYRYLIVGSTRQEVAHALCEYRRFIADNPDEELSTFLAGTCQKIRIALKAQREIERAIGWGDKPLARNV